MREILFRGKDKLGIWHYGYLHINTMLDEDKYYINSRAYAENSKYIEVIKDTVGQLTDSTDIDGEKIFEGDIVNQKSVLLGDNDNINFTGYVRFSEGRWVIDNGIEAIPLWSEHRENKIIND